MQDLVYNVSLFLSFKQTDPSDLIPHGVPSGHAFRNGIRNIVSLVQPSSSPKLKHITWSSVINACEGVMAHTRSQSLLHCGVRHRFSARTP